MTVDETVEFERIPVYKADEVWKNINEHRTFVWERFWDELARGNETWNVDYVVPCPPGGFLATLIRKIMMKLTRFYFRLVVERQNVYNANSIRTLNEVAVFIRDTEQALNIQNEINMKLQDDIQEQALRINKECIKRMEAMERQNEYLKQEIINIKGQLKDSCEK